MKPEQEISPPDEWLSRYGKRPPWHGELMQLFRRLSRIAERRGAEDPDGVAGEALKRFCEKLPEHPELLDQADPFPYIRQILLYILREICRRPLRPDPLEGDERPAAESRLGGLRQFEVEQFFRECLDTLEPEDRELMATVAQGCGDEWREQHHLSKTAYRTRLHRTRKHLQSLLHESPLSRR